jgi:hypothetical protein
MQSIQHKEGTNFVKLGAGNLETKFPVALFCQSFEIKIKHEDLS